MRCRKIAGLVCWVTVNTWLISACVPAQVPQPTVAEPTPIEEHEVDHGHEARMAELEPVSLGPGEKLQVVATTNIVAHIVSQVGDDAIELTELLPIGADPHTYIATPQDLAAISDAHLIFANGADLEADFLPELIQDTDASVVYVSEGIEFRQLGEGESHEQEDDHHDKDIDPHTWTTPANVVIFVHNVEHALIALDPSNAETYQANAETYEAQLETLDRWVRTQVETIPTENRKLVTDHAMFGYYADRYGLEQIGAVIPGFSTAAQPSAQELAALEDIIREHGVRAVFVGTTVNPSLAEQVAQDTDVTLVTLYTGSLGPEGSGVETYVGYVCYNTTSIVEALGGEVDVTGSPCE